MEKVISVRKDGLRVEREGGTCVLCVYDTCCKSVCVR